VNPLFAAALELQRFFEARGWRFCFIGGLAVQRWGEPRLTLHVDCTLLTGFGQEERYVDELLAAFVGRVDHSRAFALAHRVLLVYGPAKVPIDIALGAMPFEERCIERASPFDSRHHLARADTAARVEGRRGRGAQTTASACEQTRRASVAGAAHDGRACAPIGDLDAGVASLVADDTAGAPIDANGNLTGDSTRTFELVSVASMWS